MRALTKCKATNHHVSNSLFFWFRNFNQLSTSMKSVKDEHTSSPFRAATGTSIDPLYDPDSIIHPQQQQLTPPHIRKITKIKLPKNALKDTTITTTQMDEREDDIEQHLDSRDSLNINNKINNNFNDNKHLHQSRIIPGLKRRKTKIIKYQENILDALDRPIITKKRIFCVGDKCEGCGALLQNESVDKIGYVDNIKSNEKIASKMDENSNTETDMKDIYIPDHQRLLLMDLGIIEKHQKYLKYEQYVAIQRGNKTANNDKKKKVVLEKAICSRCFQLENYKKIRYIKENTIIPHHFNDLLTNRFRKNKVNLQQICIIKIVDIFDFHGSFIPNLHDIINKSDGTNNYFQNENIIRDIPIILAINKIDLLTSHVRKPANQNIIIEWTENECKRFNLKPYAIIPICSKTGYNVPLLLKTAIAATPIKTSLKRHDNLRTAERYRDIYIIGTTNVGKSTLLNRLLHQKLIYSTNKMKVNQQTKFLTTSYIPATTLGIIPFMVKHHLNTRLLDTPGVIQENNLCLKLTDEEYKMLVPKQPIKPITYKIKSGQSIILGSLARLDCECIAIEDGDGDDDYFYFTVFVAPMCSVHLTTIDKAEQVLSLHCGNILKPINSVERILEDPSLQMEKKQSWELNGIGLQSAVCDVVFPGIGWIALTGTNKIKFTAHSIKDLKVGVRKPLLSRDMYRNVKKYQGVPNKKW